MAPRIRILVGWLLNLALFVSLILVFAVYGCVFAGRAGDRAQDVFDSWLWSLVQRFVVAEPLLIVAAFVIPLLFGRFCTNLFSEAANNAIGIALATIVVLLKRLKRGLCGVCVYVHSLLGIT